MHFFYVADAPTPYRLHFMKRIAAELPARRFVTYFTHSASNAPWKLAIPDHLETQRLGGGGSYGVDPARSFRHDYRTGGEIIRQLRDTPSPKAVLIGGYNDAGRLRLIRWCAAHGVPVFVFADSNARGDHARGFKRLVKKLLLGWVVRRLSGVMVCGSLGREFFLNYGADDRKIYYSPYEPDYDQIEKLPPATISDAAAKFGLEPGRRRLVYSGRLVSQKRVDLLVRSFVALAGERPDWDLVIVGDGSLRQELQSLVPEALASRVKWLGFQNDQAMVSAVYRNADALCLPSEHEPWALVINEAAAAGLAVLSSDVVGASAELVRDGVNGKFFRSGDLQSCTDALRDVTDPANIDRYRAASPGVLADWRHRGDPVAGLRMALQDCGILPG